MQWLKKLWDSSFQGPYDAVNRRQALGIRASPKPAPPGQDGPLRPTKGVPPSVTNSSPHKGGQFKRNSLSSPTRSSLHPGSTSHNAVNQENAELKRKITELTVCIDRIEKERDFYFKRLRQVEVLCQNSEKNEHVERVLEILYAETASTEEAGEQ